MMQVEVFCDFPSYREFSNVSWFDLIWFDLIWFYRRDWKSQSKKNKKQKIEGSRNEEWSKRFSKLKSNTWEYRWEQKFSLPSFQIWSFERIRGRYSKSSINKVLVFQKIKWRAEMRVLFQRYMPVKFRMSFELVVMRALFFSLRLKQRSDELHWFLWGSADAFLTACLWKIWNCKKKNF
jgi:hypothetical protein